MKKISLSLLSWVMAIGIATQTTEESDGLLLKEQKKDEGEYASSLQKIEIDEETTTTISNENSQLLMSFLDIDSVQMEVDVLHKKINGQETNELESATYTEAELNEISDQLAIIYGNNNIFTGKSNDDSLFTVFDAYELAEFAEESDNVT
ncbi:hypothetical protein [Salipaludibacillus daqingensis]|uniref:hypothetical protein n=1 Tax=Salipaludibacillus daqingensis TaxID=3041001 RepID=UPI002475E754|nr:hypothetical protein [Salipaludibacillus daqingensis]